MATHRVRPGDCIASIAAEHGFGDWQEIWDHPANADLKDRRGKPTVLLEGDTVVVPAKRRKDVEVETGSAHRIRVNLPVVRLRLTLNDRRGQALADRRFELIVPGQTLTGTTDGSGRLDEAIPAAAKTAQLRLFLDDDQVLEIPLAVGQLDPKDSETGVRQRLRNLGYLRERSSDDQRLASALREFQRDNKLDITGVADQATCDRLLDTHKT